MIDLELLRKGVERILYRRNFYREHTLFKNGRPPKMRQAR